MGQLEHIFIEIQRDFNIGGMKTTFVGKLVLNCAGKRGIIINSVNYVLFYHHSLFEIS